MDEKDAQNKINGPLQERVKRLTCRDLPKLEFVGILSEGRECGLPVLRTKSKPVVWIAEIRREVGALAANLRFQVQGLVEPEDEVHITIRGRYRNSGGNPGRTSDRSDFFVTFDKLGFRRRYEFGTGMSEPFGALHYVNFGMPDYLTSGGPRHMPFVSNLLDVSEWPSLSTPSTSANPARMRRTRRAINAGMDVSSMPAEPPVLELHESTSFPLESDMEVALAASLREADLAALPENAPVIQGVFQHAHAFSDFVWLLKLKRDPQEFHSMLDTCDELQKCREDLRAAEKELLSAKWRQGFRSSRAV
mmetsp:Transcript_15270/g.29536  ORF Transcript_15270/g.29536 Transcript_15270/m.29536 type:complete len:306 (-) Transcript_15270:784-1701(-)